MTTSNETERLTSMLKEKKISKEDYKLLTAALAKKTPFADETLALLMNPFQKIAGLPALALGLVIILIMSYLGTKAKVYFPGIIDVTNAALWPKINFSFLVLLYQNLVSWLTMAILFLVTAIILRQRGIRFSDFFGTVALARLPYLILIGIFSFIRWFQPNPGNLAANISGTAPVHYVMDAIFTLLWLVFSLWQIIIYFYALKASSGLNGKKLWISFLLLMILAEAIASVLTMAFV